MADAKQFLRHVIAMMAGTALAQAIPLLAAPFLTRLYSPTEFGALSAIVAAGGTLSVLVTLRYELAIVLPSEEKAAANLGAFALGCSFLLCSAMALLVVLCPALFEKVFAGGSQYLLAIPLLAAMIGWSQILSFTANRERRYATIATSSVMQQLGAAGISLALGATTSQINGLIVGRFAGYAIFSVFSVVRLGPILRSWTELVSLAGMLENARLYKQFPIFNVPYSLLSNFSRDFLVLAFTATHQIEAAGFYGLARTALTVPMGFLSASMSQVFYKEAVVSIGTPEFKRLTINSLRYLGAGIAPFFVLGWFWAPDAFQTIFGPRWRDAGSYAALLMPISYLSMFTSWPERVFEVRSKQYLSLTIQALFDSTTVALVTVALMNGTPPIVAIKYYVAVQFIYHLTYLAAVFHLSGFNPGSYVKFVALATIAIGIASILEFLAAQCVDATWLKFVVSVLVAIMTSMLFLLLAYRSARSDSRALA